MAEGKRPIGGEGERRRAPRAQDRNRRVTEAGGTYGSAASKTAITSDLR